MELIVTRAATTRISAKLVFVVSLINFTHLLKVFGKSLKSHSEKELSFSLDFLIFRYSQAVHKSSQLRGKDNYRRYMISKEIRREEFDSQIHQHSPEVVSREVSQKRKTSIKRRKKIQVRYSYMTLSRP